MSEDEIEGASLQECGLALGGLSKEGIRQLERKALAKLRTAFVARFGEDGVREMLSASANRESAWDRIARG
jgi:DNA-directed RNA polymerase sigma subunit (sigma70/sigma32)